MQKRRKVKWSVMSIFGFVMVALYIGLGIYLLVSKSFAYIPKNFKIGFAAFFIVYGIFRFVRLYFKITSNYDEES